MNQIKKDKYITRLQANKKTMLAALEDVNETLFNTKNSAETWSIAEIIEHVIKVETTVIRQLKTLSVSASIFENAPSDEDVLERSSSRKVKAVSPKPFVPTGLFKDKKTAISAFKQNRTQTEDFFNTTSIDLKSITFPHPRLGIFNGENWLMFIIGHAIKHMEQIELIKNTI